MNTYTAQILGTPTRGFKPDDLAAEASSEVARLTILNRFNVKRFPNGTVAVTLNYEGLNDNEAQETARRAARAMTCEAAAEVVSLTEKRRIV